MLEDFSSTSLQTTSNMRFLCMFLFCNLNLQRSPGFLSLPKFIKKPYSSWDLVYKFSAKNKFLQLCFKLLLKKNPEIYNGNSDSAHDHKYRNIIVVGRSYPIQKEKLVSQSNSTSVTMASYEIRKKKTGANKKSLQILTLLMAAQSHYTLVIKVCLCMCFFFIITTFKSILNYFITHSSWANSSPSDHHRLTWQIFELCFQIPIP